MFVLPPALAALDPFRQFIVWKAVPSTRRPGKIDKFPIDWRTGDIADAHDSAIWLDWSEAAAYAAAFGPTFGVGFVFTVADPFWFVDIDKCLKDGAWSPLALELLGRFQGAAVEVSQSGTGLHIIGQGVAPDHRKRNDTLGLEFYTEARFVALTGTSALGDAGTRHDAALADLTELYFKPDPAVAAGTWTTEPAADWNGPDDDATLIERACRSSSAASAFGAKASFMDLWTANESVLARMFPDPDGRPYNASSADAALAQHLAFWTGKNCERIDTLMRQSALLRDKWDRSGDDYLRRTILAQVARQRDVLQDKPPEPLARIAASETAPAARAVSGGTFLTGTDQIEFFRGCVYICTLHRILVPGGRLLKPDQFRAMYGGYSYSMDPMHERVVRNAWEAFSESQAIRAPRADGTCFRPELPPAAIIEEAGDKFANVWWPIETPRADGDAGPFTRHLEKLFPIESDRAALVAYLAAIVQYPGVKFQWAPLVQGVEGNGKTFILTAMTHAVGSKYTHLPNTSALADGGLKFVSWLSGKLLIGLEEIYTEDRREVAEALKAVITNPRLEFESKGVDQSMGDNRANILAFSNHKGAVPKTTNDRRWGIFYTAQQRFEDLARDGMDGNYMPDLWDWFEGTDDYAGETPGKNIINGYLRDYRIPDELNPATKAHRAPVTSGTAEAISVSMGAIEQEVVEAIEREDVGFAGGFVSSMALEKLLVRLRAERRLPPRKRRDLMVSLGYDWHPHLKEGRVNNAVRPDNGKIRVFVKPGSLQSLLDSSGKIADAYEKAQDRAATVGVFSVPAPPAPITKIPS